MIELPDSFLEEMKKQFGNEYENYLNCFDNPRHYGLRVNTNKISVEDFEKISPFKLVKVPWINNGFYYNGDEINPAKHPYYHAGLYYLQEPSAMTPASVLPIKTGDRVLDMCAAPGGKATEIGVKLRNTGLLVANDISSSRARGLLKNIELFGIGNVLVLSEEPGQLKEEFNNYFDKILIDAPCSGEGMFRKEPKLVKEWKERGPEYYIPIQRELIQIGVEMLKPGGYLLYSTCTFNKGENEDAILFLLEKYPYMESVEIDEDYKGFTKGNPPLTNSRRLYPFRIKGEGHFLALLKKAESRETSVTFRSEEDSNRKTKQAALSKEFLEFLKLIKPDFDKDRFAVRNDRVYYESIAPSSKKKRVLRNGLFMGEQKKGRFEPSQSLALYLNMEDYKYILDLKSDCIDVIKYLKGETLIVEGLKDKEYYLVCVDGYPLGFAKYGNGKLKNKYEQGWRMM